MLPYRPPDPPYKSAMLRGKTETGPKPIRLSQNSEQSRTSVKKPSHFNKALSKLPRLIDFRCIWASTQGVFKDGLGLGVPWYFRNRSYDTMLPLFNRRKMKKFAILICVNRKICDNLELEKIVVLRKRIIPFIFSSLRNPFDPSQPLPMPC